MNLLDRLFWRLFLAISCTLLAAVASVSWLAARSIRQSYFAYIENDLFARAALVKETCRDVFSGADRTDCEASFQGHGASTDSTRFTLILASGEVISDSAHDPDGMESHSNRPEIRSALLGKRSASVRFSRTSHERLMYVAVPVEDMGRVVGVIRGSVPVDGIDRQLASLYRRISAAAVAVACLGAVLSWWIARFTARPLEVMSRRLAAGNSRGKRLPVVGSAEVGVIAEAVNRLTLELEQAGQLASRQDRELETIMASTTEGVLVTDNDGRVLRVNSAALGILQLRHDAIIGKLVSSTANNGVLERLVAQGISGTSGSTHDLVSGAGTGRYVLATSTPLQDSFGRTIGAVIVMSDWTRIRKLDHLRRDFTANVSHELKTPLTAIQGFADTLLQGALEEPEEARHFVRVISEQARRLRGVIEGLMDLTRLEGQAERQEIDRTWHHLKDVLSPLLETFSARSSEVRAELELDCPDGLTARVNAPLLERAIANLVDNALRYGGKGVRVAISVEEDGESIGIAVTDDGMGMEPAESARIFERFYRVGRSTDQHPEGSGLGLAI
ncbi:MAG TPA: histidine kinase dimerization/phospho-acceptor domain-containing protein, partial [Vicinamibacteria bacterium]|nr:histidine kinase dimerization/phospho-acceptor domain-containing protein [Vicinamibacteria bacterium]